jgi:MerR family transcriptional regulator, redox-sensitive transcriptional activator SoxR
MSGLSIGQVANHAGLRTSAIRYYEREGLIPKAARRNGRRIYDASVLDHLLFVRLALRSGFRIGEVKPMVKGLTTASKPGDRWRAAATDKLGELEREIKGLQVKKKLLQDLVSCQCPSLAHFARSQMSRPQR